MAFLGHSFVFDGVPCENFELMLYDVGGESGGGEIASTVSIVEEQLSSRWKPLFYGTKFENKLEFNIVFGPNMARLDKRMSFDRYEIEAIASWLTGHDGYRWLEIEQGDLEYVRYKCIVSSLQIVEYGRYPWAMQAHIICDSPYAYQYPQEFTYELYNSRRVVTFYNESSHNGFYMPRIEYTPRQSSMTTTLNITNQTDGGRALTLRIPAFTSFVSIDNDKCVITGEGCDNFYPYFNNVFLRLKRGYNVLSLFGAGTLKIICEFPVNVGG